MGDIATTEILAFLRKLGERYTRPAAIYLLGGSALCFLGNPRRTADIDYFVETTPDQTVELQATIESLALELTLELEVVAIGEFVPLPEGTRARRRLIGQFGNLTTYVYDPYTIAISKVARGFETDLQDVLFMLRQKLIEFKQLEAYVNAALPRAKDFDIDPTEFQQHLEEIGRLV